MITPDSLNLIFTFSVDRLTLSHGIFIASECQATGTQKTLYTTCGRHSKGFVGYITLFSVDVHDWSWLNIYICTFAYFFSLDSTYQHLYKYPSIPSPHPWHHRFCQADASYLLILELVVPAGPLLSTQWAVNFETSGPLKALEFQTNPPFSGKWPSSQSSGVGLVCMFLGADFFSLVFGRLFFCCFCFGFCMLSSWRVWWRKRRDG